MLSTLILGALVILALGTGVLVYRRRRRSVAPPPLPDARPSQYVVRWEHINFGAQYLYQGPDLRRARWAFYEGQGIRPGATVEFYEGPHRRAVRTA